MIRREEYDEACERAYAEVAAAGIALSSADRGKIVAADFGFSTLKNEGAQILTFFATERISAKLIVLFPGQVLPEHRHPPVETDSFRDPGKEEIIRVQAGELVLGLEGPGDAPPEIPRGKEGAYRCRRILRLGPGEQILLEPGSWHWLAGGVGGAVLFSFSTCVRDFLDEFSDPAIRRSTVIVD